MNYINPKTRFVIIRKGSCHKVISGVGGVSYEYKNEPIYCCTKNFYSDAKKESEYDVITECTSQSHPELYL